MRAPALALCLILAGSMPALAQTDPAVAPPSAEAVPVAPAPPAPYEGPMLRLAELMGSLHYLRGLCGNPDAPLWRDRMTSLLDGETTDEARKSRLAGSFNRGYRTFQQTYHACNPSAEATIRAYLDEGRRIARDIGARYAG